MTANGASTTGDVRVTDIDGVPAVWADVPGPFAAGILVRVGHVDETLARHGITHMLEHLALFGLDRPGDHSNGQVDTTTLALHVAAEPVDAAQFLTRAAAQLADPPVARLEDERGVLRTEAARRPGHPMAEMLGWRWGVCGYGLEVADEYGLPHLTPEAIRQWSATYVNHNNAVLWFTGPPPKGLRFLLPDGERRSLPDPYASPLPAFPAYFTSNAPVVVTHGLVQRSAAAVALAGVLGSRLLNDLRRDRAAAYSPEAAYRPISGETAAVIQFSDIVQGRESEVARRVLDATWEFDSSGDTMLNDELEAHRTTVRRSLESGAEAGMVMSSAWNLVHGAPVQTVEEVLDNLARLTPADVRTAAEELRGTLLAQLPFGAAVPFNWKPAPYSPAAPVKGGRKHARLDGGGHLRVAPAGVTLTEGTASATVLRDRVAALGRWDDGGRFLIGEDGVHLKVEPTLWRRGRRAVADIDAAVPAEKTVPLGARPTGAIPRLRLRQRVRGLRSRVAFLAVVVLAVTAVIAAIALKDRVELSPAASTAMLLLILVIAARYPWDGK